MTCIKILLPLLVHAGGAGTLASAGTGAVAGAGGVASAAPVVAAAPFPTNTARAALGALASAEDVQTVDAHLHELQAAVATWRHASAGRYAPFSYLHDVDGSCRQ